VDTGAGAIRRRLALGMAVFMAAGLLALVAPGEAHAAAPPCSGRKIRTFVFSTGQVQVFRKRNYICAVTMPKRAGKRQPMSVSVQARGSRAVVNKGKFTRYAGPVTVHVGHRRIWIKGSVGAGRVSSGWFQC